LAEIVERNIDVAGQREASLDVKISKFISDNFRSKCLFFSINHPTGHLLYYVISSILRRLELPELDVSIRRKHATILGSYRWAASPSVYAGLELGFDGADFFYAEGRRLSVEKFARSSFDFYDRNPDLVAANAKLPVNGARPS
jgi:hypothetical protein